GTSALANPAYPRWRDWRKCVGGNGENYIDANKRLLRRREEMLARGVPAAKANAATAAELVRWLWALGTMCREGAE
ncbi:MAG: hypothetical protein KHZ14_04740, partial [Collinsella sp.]|nr:hypothetical protein [Collinsella sp.]